METRLIMEPNIAQKIDVELGKYPKHSYPKGQILIFGGEEPECIFYITKGRVREYDVSYKGDEVIVNVFKPPAFFPMSWVINKKPNKYFFKAETDCEVHSVPPEKALEFIQANPDVQFDLLKRVYSGTDGLLDRIVHLMSGTAQSRLLFELVISCHRFGEQTQQGWLLVMNEGDLAARCGLSRETVSREIHKLTKPGLLTLDNKGIVIKDFVAIKKKLGIELENI